MSRRGYTEGSRHSVDLNDTDYFRHKINQLETALQNALREKNMLSQDTEELRYKLVNIQKEEESRMAIKATELRRQNNKLKSMEIDLKNLNKELEEEKKLSNELVFNFECAVNYLFDSFCCIKNNFDQIMSNYVDCLVCLG